MRVLHLIPDLTMGGAQMLMVNLLGAIDHSRWTPRVVSMFGPHHNHLEKRLDDAGVEVRSLGKRLGPDPRMLWRLEREIRSFAPDVLHTHCYVLGYLAPLLATWRTPSVHTCHTLAQHETGRLGRALYRLAFRTGTVPIAISTQVAQSMNQVFGIQRMPVILNGIPVHRFATPQTPPDAWRRREGFGEDDFLIAIVGRLSEEKNHPLLLDAFARVAHQMPRAQVVVVGDGAQRASIEALAETLSIRDRTHLLGQRDDIADVLHAADVLVLSSTFEGIPLTVQEAMATGTPVIATAVGGVPELVVHNQTGVLVPSEDSDALGRALLRMETEPAWRAELGVRACSEATARFDIVGATRAYERVYDAVKSGDDPVQAASTEERE